MSGPSRSEASIEGAVVEYAKRRASVLKFELLVRKMNGLGNRSWPDRMFIFSRDGGPAIFFIEFKRPGTKLTPLQEVMKMALVNMGVRHYICDEVSAGKHIIDMEFGQ